MTIDAEIDANAAGVAYAPGGAGSGLVLHMENGQLVSKYNMMIIERYIDPWRGQACRGAHE